MPNLHQLFDWQYIGQILVEISQIFVAFSEYMNFDYRFSLFFQVAILSGITRNPVHLVTDYCPYIPFVFAFVLLMVFLDCDQHKPNRMFNC